jgi:uncharacterized cupredoxin-like copper-binding protein
VAFELGEAPHLTPSLVKVTLGETLRLQVHNGGTRAHAFVFGTAPELRAASAKRPNALPLAPGQRGEIVWQFNRAGEFLFACQTAGHGNEQGKLRVEAK